MHRITVIGGGFAGLTAAITAAEAGAKVTVYEAHHTLGGRARTAEGPYRANEGPHALYSGGPHWTWLQQRDLIGPLAPVPLLEPARLRLHHKGALRRTLPFALLKLLRRSSRLAPVDTDFMSWAAAQAGEEGARAAAHYSAVTLFHHDPGSLSATFVQQRLRRAANPLSEARHPLGGWAAVIDRMAARAWNLGVRIETLARVDALPEGHGPVVVATSLDAARRLLKDDSLTWTGGRTALLDLALRTRRGDEIPENLDFAQAVAMIGTGRTTMGILQFAELGPDSVAVIPAAAGGIGTLLVQYARQAGATVIGLAGGPEKVARVRENGADLAVDYTDTTWPRQVRAHLGGRNATVDLLGPDGKHLVFGWSGEGIQSGEPLLVEDVSEQVLGPVMMRKAGGPNPVRTLELRALAEAAAGRLTPALTRFPLAQAAAAHRALETRGTIGKVVLEP